MDNNHKFISDIHEQVNLSLFHVFDGYGFSRMWKMHEILLHHSKVTRTSDLIKMNHSVNPAKNQLVHAMTSLPVTKAYTLVYAIRDDFVTWCIRFEQMQYARHHLERYSVTFKLAIQSKRNVYEHRTLLHIYLTGWEFDVFANRNDVTKFITLKWCEWKCMWVDIE